MEKFRDRKFMILLYPDNDLHVKALEIIKINYDYACVLHDKDVDSDGVLKKAHYHVILMTGKNAIWNTALATSLGIDPVFVGTKIGKLENALEYLIHANDLDKFQYTLDDVEGQLKVRLKESLNNDEKTEGEKVLILLDYIDNFEGVLSVTTFMRYCASNGYWDVYRRTAYGFNEAIKEHNEKVYRNRVLNEDFTSNAVSVTEFCDEDSIKNQIEQIKIKG